MYFTLHGDGIDQDREAVVARRLGLSANERVVARVGVARVGEDVDLADAGRGAVAGVFILAVILAALMLGGGR